MANVEDSLKFVPKLNRKSFKDIEGKRFGRLKVLGYAGVGKVGKSEWFTLCDCGTTKKIRANNLLSGTALSCGCYHKEIATKNATKHNGCGTKLYGVWNKMIRRCCNPKDQNYDKYGEVGIKVCEEWINSFKVFRKWASCNGYEEGKILDRIDGDKDYCPDNCRFVGYFIQTANIRIKSNNTTGFTGIYKDSKTINGKTYTYWRAIVTSKKKTVFSRSFPTIEEATIERDNFIIKNELPHRLSNFYNHK